MYMGGRNINIGLLYTPEIRFQSHPGSGSTHRFICDFRKWVHREFKNKGGSTPSGGQNNPDLTGEELANALEEWMGSK